jgi:hypothetical protein
MFDDWIHEIDSDLLFDAYQNFHVKIFFYASFHLKIQNTPICSDLLSKHQIDKFFFKQICPICLQWASNGIRSFF